MWMTCTYRYLWEEKERERNTKKPMKQIVGFFEKNGKIDKPSSKFTKKQKTFKLTKLEIKIRI